MTDKFISTIAIVLSLIAILVVLFGGSLKEATLGAVGTLPIENYIPAIMYNDGYYSAKAIVTTADMTASGGTLTVTTSNTSTSTAIIGCVQSYATSTATPWAWYTLATSTGIAAGFDGYIVADMGSCPNL